MKNKVLVSMVFVLVLLIGGKSNAVFGQQQMQFMTYRTCLQLFFPNNNIDFDTRMGETSNVFKEATWGLNPDGTGILQIFLNSTTDSVVSFTFQRTELDGGDIIARNVRCQVSQGLGGSVRTVKNGAYAHIMRYGNQYYFSIYPKDPATFNDDEYWEAIMTIILSQ
jgi:hypothetical protein